MDAGNIITALTKIKYKTEFVNKIMIKKGTN